MTGPTDYPGAPRWLKMSAIAIAIGAPLLVVLIHANGAPLHHVPFIGGLSHHTAVESGR